MEIASADQASAAAAASAASAPTPRATQSDPAAAAAAELELDDYSSIDTNTLLNQLLAEVSSNVEEQGPWSQWWPPMEEVELPVAGDLDMPMLL